MFAMGVLNNFYENIPAKLWANYINEFSYVQYRCGQ